VNKDESLNSCIHAFKQASCHCQSN